MYPYRCKIFKTIFGITADSNRVQFPLSDISRCLLMKGVASVTDDFSHFTYFFNCFFFARFSKRQIFLTVVGDYLHPNNLLSFA